MPIETSDPALSTAREIIMRASRDATRQPVVQEFFDADTSSMSYVVRDRQSSSCAVIDSVLDFETSSGRTRTKSANAIVSHLQTTGGQPEWILETHVHADHLTAAPYIKKFCGGKTAIGNGILGVQKTFARVFNANLAAESRGKFFDHMFSDGERFNVGELEGVALHVPGHTPACVAYVIGDAVFTGDTLFMPDYGTARCDFPDGDARALFHSIRRLFQLPDETRLYLCHDYLNATRIEHRCQSTVGEQRKKNIHVRDGTDEASFVRLRRARDATLSMPRLMLPAVQVNMMAGRLPQAEDNGVRYLKIPIDLL